MLLVVNVVLGGLLVWVGAELLVRGSSHLAARLGMPPLLIGATIVAFGTSAPEAVVSLVGHIEGKTGISLGNILGSNVCNIGLVLGITALVLPVRVRPLTLRRELPLVIVAEALVLFLAFNGALSRGDGIVMLLSFVAIYGYLAFDGIRVRRASQDDTEPPERRYALPVTFTVAGLGLLVVGAHFFVEGAAAIATRLGMSETLVGATIVAFGTSLPELVTSLVAAMRGQLEISLGNLLGSNLFNALLVGGSLAVIGNVPIGSEELWHAWWMLGTTVVVWPLMLLNRPAARRGEPRMTRVGGVILLAAYVAYVAGSIKGLGTA